MIENLLKRIERQLPDLESKFTDYKVYAIEVSAWSVGDHLEHLLHAHLVILHRIETHFYKEPEKGKKLTLPGRLVLFFGRFLRGVGKAPNLFVPKGASELELREKFKELNACIENLKQKIPDLTASHYAFPHPVFGLLTVRQWLRFIEVHTRHHLRIIEAIQAEGNDHEPG